MRKILILFVGAILLVSCQFKETMVMNEDGGGRMSVSVDLTELMAMSNEFGADSTMTKQDTIIHLKDVFEEKKDSISQLPQAEQDRLAKIANFSVRTMMDPESNQLMFDVFTDFEDVAEANELMAAFQESDQFMPGNTDTNKADDGSEDPSYELIGVDYSYKNKRFVRNAFIKDPEKHKVQLDSLVSVEAFLSSMTYTLSYTFPSKIKSASAQDAKLSMDGKTIELERSFIDYFKDPDVLDLEVILED